MRDADFHALDPFRLAIAPDGQARRSGWVSHAQVFDDRLHCDRLANQAVGWRLDHPHPAVGFLAGGCDQHVQRGVIQDFRRLLDARRVVDLAIGNQDRTGKAATRDIGQSAVDGGEQIGPGVAAFRYHHGAQFQAADMAGLFGDVGAGGLGQTGALADLHRGGLIDHQQADIGQAFPAFPHQHGTAQP